MAPRDQRDSKLEVPNFSIYGLSQSGLRSLGKKV